MPQTMRFVPPVPAWLRFLPEPTPDIIGYAALIEAYAIVVRLAPEDKDALDAVHRRAERYARLLYSDDAIRKACAACAAASPGTVALVCPEYLSTMIRASTTAIAQLPASRVIDFELARARPPTSY